METAHSQLKKICIVAPEIIGPTQNGGIGTHCYWLSKLYAEQKNCAVTLLFTGVNDANVPMISFKKKFSKDKIEFVDISPWPQPSYPQYGGEWFTERSMKVYHYCTKNHFDAIHFQDWHANGFIPIQAKRMGLAFDKTLLTVTMHSSLQWTRQAMRSFPKDVLGDAKLDYAERYCCEHADQVISLSPYMLTWAQQQGWQIPANPQIRPTVFPSHLVRLSDPSSEPSSEPWGPTPDVSHLTFFGRLETRKGLELFCDALVMLVKTHPDHGVRKITFLGRCGSVRVGIQDIPSTEYILDTLEPLRAQGIEIDTITTVDTLGAMDYIRQTRSICVMPSLQENFPYTVIECFMTGVFFLASRVGGIPDIVSGGCLFDPNLKDLCDALYERNTRIYQKHPVYHWKTAQDRWLDLLNDVPVTPPILSKAIPESALSESAWPQVSICVAHFNHGTYLAQLLLSLFNTCYPNLEVIVADDASTCAASQEEFKKQKLAYASCPWKFLTKPTNEGLAATRNFAAAHAQGQYLIFMDSDNIAMPSMVHDFVQSMRASGADCLTCHFFGFSSDHPPQYGDLPVYTYLPLGPCIQAGIFENVFGDANFCIKRDVFTAIGGFHAQASQQAFTDWETLAYLALHGYQLDVIPKQLFYYRHLHNSMHRTANIAESHQHVMNVYRDCQSMDLTSMLLDTCVPMYYQITRLQKQHTALDAFLSQDGYKAIHKLNLVLNRYPRLKRTLLRASRSAWKAARASYRMAQRSRAWMSSWSSSWPKGSHVSDLSQH